MKDNKVVDQIRTLKYEFKILSSKKPNDVLNEFKVKYVNKSLKAANELLGKISLTKILNHSVMRNFRPIVMC